MRLMACLELEGFAVHSNWQRRGIGSMLIKKFLEAVDAVHTESYVGASRIGRPLYEKFGFKAIGECAIDLKKYGDYPTYLTFAMKREAV